MTSHDLPAQPTIRHLLVRLRPAGEVIGCGTIKTPVLSRGQTCVVQTADGMWLADYLAELDPQANVALVGEWLRVASAEDLEQESSAATSAETLRQATEQHVQALGLDLVVVATEVGLEQAAGTIRFLGAASEALGPLAVRLAHECELDRVRWQSLQSSEPNAAPEASEPSAAESLEHAFWERFHSVTTSGETLGQSLGQPLRQAAGNRGLYQQKRRGESPPGRRLPSGRSWMVRVRTAAGGLTATQLLRLYELAEQFGDGTLRLTTRQAIQLHGVAPDAPATVLEELQSRLLHTLGSCGNAVRNLSCCPFPVDADPVGGIGQSAVRNLAAQLATELLPSGPAFEFRWSEPSQPKPSPPTNHQQPLPHKFKVGIASDRHNCIDVLTNDLAFVVRTDRSTGHQQAVDVDLYVGGSTAYRPADRDSFPQLAQWLGTVPITAASLAAEMLLGMFRRRQTVGPRHLQRFKYVVRRTGIETLSEQFQQQAGDRVKLNREAPAPLPQAAQQHAERGQTITGQAWQRMHPPLGRLTSQHAKLLRQWADAAATIRIGSEYDLVICQSAAEAASLGQNEVDCATLPYRACPALPTCPLAVAAAETEWDAWSTAVHRAASLAGVSSPRFSLSGCTNGCAHSLTTPIGLIAEAPRRRKLFLGGGPTRLGKPVGEVATPTELTDLLAGWLKRYAADRSEKEDFEAWFQRKYCQPDHDLAI